MCCGLGTCSKCGSEFEATQKELESESKIVDDQRDRTWAQETCTECGHDVFLHPKEDRTTYSPEEAEGK